MDDDIFSFADEICRGALRRSLTNDILTRVFFLSVVLSLVFWTFSSEHFLWKAVQFGSKTCVAPSTADICIKAYKSSTETVMYALHDLKENVLGSPI